MKGVNSENILPVSLFEAARSKLIQSSLIPGSLNRLCAVMSFCKIKSWLFSFHPHRPSHSLGWLRSIQVPLSVLHTHIIWSWFDSNKSNMSWRTRNPAGHQDVFPPSLRGGGPLPPPPRGGSGPRPAAAPAGGSSAGAGCRAGWRAPRPGCRARTGGGCRRRRSAASWSDSDATFPAAGPWRRHQHHTLHKS